jgi:phospholipase/carboxylesterase
MLTRRGFLAAGAGVLAAGAAVVRAVQSTRRGDSLLRVRPRQPTRSITPGQHSLDLGRDRDGVLVVPRGYSPEQAAPLALMLHGAGGQAQRLASRFPMADEFGVILLVPDSRGTTWDAIRGPFGADVQFIDRALEQAFDRCTVNSKRLAIGGFSDGATYALSLGLDNGTLFTHVMAFSPGFTTYRRPQGRPRIFISHGRSDEILPINVCSRRIVPALEDAGYGVTYKEFDGPHTVPEVIAEDAFKWLVR